MLDFGTSKSNSEVSKTNSNIQQGKLILLFENSVTSEGPVSHKVLYYQQLLVDCYQVSFYAHNYFEKLPSQCPVHF